jgi:predicted nuclease of predicted toxin-antitoxin system
LRLLLDEHFSRAIAEQLRARGHDVAAVTERDELRGIGDEALLAFATAERRALVTQDVPDFTVLLQDAAVVGSTHYGVVFTHERAFPRSKAGIGALVSALEELLSVNPSDEALVERSVWLTRSA